MSKGADKMDRMKRETVKDYTAQDLNAKCVHIRNRQKLEAKIKRSARRKMKKSLTSPTKYDIISTSKGDMNYDV